MRRVQTGHVFLFLLATLASISFLHFWTLLVLVALFIIASVAEKAMVK